MYAWSKWSVIKTTPCLLIQIWIVQTHSVWCIHRSIIHISMRRSALRSVNVFLLSQLFVFGCHTNWQFKSWLTDLFLQAMHIFVHLYYFLSLVSYWKLSEGGCAGRIDFVRGVGWKLCHISFNEGLLSVFYSYSLSTETTFETQVQPWVLIKQLAFPENYSWVLSWFMCLPSSWKLGQKGTLTPAHWKYWLGYFGRMERTEWRRASDILLGYLMPIILKLLL